MNSARPFLLSLCVFLVSCEKDGAFKDIIETSKRSLEAAQETHEKLKGQIESIKKEKARIEREVEEENAHALVEPILGAERVAPPVRTHTRSM